MSNFGCGHQRVFLFKSRTKHNDIFFWGGGGKEWIVFFNFLLVTCSNFRINSRRNKCQKRKRTNRYRIITASEWKKKTFWPGGRGNCCQKTLVFFKNQNFRREGRWAGGGEKSQIWLNCFHHVRVEKHVAFWRKGGHDLLGPVLTEFYMRQRESCDGFKISFCKWDDVISKMWQVYSVGGREDLSKMLIFTSKIKKKNWTEDNFKKKIILLVATAIPKRKILDDNRPNIQEFYFSFDFKILSMPNKNQKSGF